LEQLPSNKRYVAIALKVWKNHVILGATATSRWSLCVMPRHTSRYKSNMTKEPVGFSGTFYFKVQYPDESGLINQFFFFERESKEWVTQ